MKDLETLNQSWHFIRPGLPGSTANVTLAGLDRTIEPLVIVLHVTCSEIYSFPRHSSDIVVRGAVLGPFFVTRLRLTHRANFMYLGTQ